MAMFSFLGLFVCLFVVFFFVFFFFPCSINLAKFAADAICSSKQGRNDSEHVSLCRVCIGFSFGFSVAEISAADGMNQQEKTTLFDYIPLAQL